MKTMKYVDVTYGESEELDEQQKATIAMVPKLEEFCATNKLSLRDLEVVSDVLRDTLFARKIGQ
jgi:hypothetical protein